MVPAKKKATKKKKVKKTVNRIEQKQEDNKHILFQTLLPVYLCWENSLNLMPSSNYAMKEIIEEMILLMRDR